MRGAIVVTGATGLLGGDALRRLLAARPGLRAYALARDPARVSRLGGRVRPVRADLLEPGLGITAADRATLARDVGVVLHFAADTRFSQTRDAASAVNVGGTARLLELAAEWPGVERFVLASTAFAAGRRTGLVGPGDGPAAAGWVNEYERSKHEAEALVRRAGRPYVIFRPSTAVYDAASRAVTQVNAVHRALRVIHGGLAAMVPGDASSPVDLVTADYVADAIARLALEDDVLGETLHLCAGAGAMPLGELLDRAYAHWSRDADWRRRGIPRPAITDLETYRLMERSVEETGSGVLVRVIRSLSHFAPQLAYPKRFDTTRTDALLGHRAPAVASFWDAVLERMRPAAREAA